MDYNSLIKSIKKKKGSSIPKDDLVSLENDFPDIFIEYYKEVKFKGNSDNYSTLFSDFYGADISEGLVLDFKLNNLKRDFILQTLKQLGNKEYEEVATHLIREYHTQLVAKGKWMAYMGIMERLLLQLSCYSKLKIVYGTQKQKSGKNKFEYILLRAPFVDLIKGKTEIRVYFNKMEDYPNYKSIEELVKGDMNFVSKAREEVRARMKEIIDSNDITFTDIESAFKKIESEVDRKEISAYEKKRTEWIKKHNFETD